MRSVRWIFFRHFSRLRQSSSRLAESSSVANICDASEAGLQSPGESVLDACREDVSVYAPYHQPSFNIAAYVNKSPVLQKLVDLGVNLYKIETIRGAPEFLLKLDFDRDMKKYIQFLHDIHVPADYLGEYITKNPFIFKQDMENLKIRVVYLLSKNFSTSDIPRIVTKSPLWLNHSIDDIDSRLGFFQDNFELGGGEVRFVTVRMPKLITYNLRKVEENKFCVIEEMGLTAAESKELILRKPKVYILSRKHLSERFNFIHNVMGIPQHMITSQPEVLLARERRLKERHSFLQSLGKNQYDPSKPGYLSPSDVALKNDVEFCSLIAKVPVQVYNKFLKTL